MEARAGKGARESSADAAKSGWAPVMSQPLRQVIIAYLACMLLACLYVPWEARPQIRAISAPWVTYSFVWQRPQTIGYHHQLATRRLLLEIASLTAILVIAVHRLGKAGADG